MFTWSQNQKVLSAPDEAGRETFWVWTHRQPRAIEGKKRGRVEWHAFISEDDAKQFAEKVDSYARFQNEVGSGRPPRETVENYDYIPHWEDWQRP